MTALSIRESADLAAIEAEIEQDRDEWLSRNVARLTRIRDDRLYRDKYGTFEDYCQERWGLTRRHVNNMIQQGKVEAVLGTMVPNVNERQARELAPLLDQPERLRETWQQVNEQTGGKPTAAAIRAVVRPEPVATVTTTTKTVEDFVADRQAGEVMSVEDWQAQRAIEDPLPVTPTAEAEAAHAREVGAEAWSGNLAKHALFFARMNAAAHRVRDFRDDYRPAAAHSYGGVTRRDLEAAAAFLAALARVWDEPIRKVQS